MGRHQKRTPVKLIIEIDLSAGRDIKQVLLDLAVKVGKEGIPKAFRRYGVALDGSLAASLQGSVAPMKPVFVDKNNRFAFTAQGTLQELWDREPARILKQYTCAVPEMVRPENATPGMSAGTWIYQFVAELVIPSHMDPYLRPGVPCLRLSGRRFKPNRPDTRVNATIADLKRMSKELTDLIPFVGMTADNDVVAAFFKDVADCAAPEAIKENTQ